MFFGNGFGGIAPRRAFRCAAFALMVGALPSAWASIQMQSVNLPAVIGRGQTVAVAMSYQATGAGPTDTITIPVPSNLLVSTPATPGCVTAGAPGSETLTCTVTTPALGDNGSLSVNLAGRVVLSGLNITATSGNTVSQSYSVIEAGDLQISKAVSAATVVNGQSFTFTLTPSVAAGGDPVANTAVVRVTDNLPGSTAQYQLTGISAAGYSCNTVAAAQAARQVVCDFTGNGAAAMGPIVLTGRTTLPGSGNLTNNVDIATADSKYIDLNVNNNTAAVSFAVGSGTDPEPLGSFTSPALTSAVQNFTLTYRNNGPQSTVGAVVRLAVPSGFTVNSVTAPACTDTLTSGVINGITGDIIACTSGTVASGATQAFTVSLTAPGSVTSGNFGIEVVTSGSPPLLPDGAQDYVPGNNQKLVPYSIIAPAADMSLNKTKSGGPLAAGASITSTITVTNNSIATAIYSGTGGGTPLRIADDMSVDEVFDSASAGWTCVDNANTPAVGSHRVVCERTVGGSLAPNASLTLTLTTHVAIGIALPTTLTNTACSGVSVLTLLGLTPADGPQPPGNSSANDCVSKSVIGTPVVTVPMTIVKESSVDNVTWVDPTTPTSGLPRLLAGSNTLYWRWTITTGAGAQTIPTLNVSDTLPAVLNLTKTAPIPSAKTPATNPVTVITGSATGSCPNLGIGAAGLNCTFTDVAPSTTIVVTIPVDRPLASSVNPFTNTVTLSSPDAILSGTLSDTAALYVDPRSDWVMTAMTINPGTPKVGQDITLTATATNYGPDANQQPVVITSHVDPTKYLLTSATAAGMTCAINSPAAGDVTCTETAASTDPYVTRTVNMGARILKPGALPGSGTVFAGESISATVTMNAADCEWRLESATVPVQSSAACNDAAASSNNTKAVTFDVTVPVIDLVQRKLQAYPAGQTSFAFGDALTYRLRVQNAGPSRAEGVKAVDRLSLPAGVTVTGIAVSNINGVAADAGYALDSSKNASVSCSITAGVPAVPTADTVVPGAPGDVVCVLDPVAANSFLGASKEVNFLLSFTTNNSLSTKFIAGNRSAACADESLSYESAGKCSFETSGANSAGNNIAVVSDVVYPKTDLAITKTRITAIPVDVGQPVRYDLAVQNLGANGTTAIRVTDQLPANFEWVTGMAKVDATTTLDTTPSAATSGAGAGSVSAVSCSASPASLSVVGSSQLLTCDLSGSFPASATGTYTVTLWAKPKYGFFTGPYLNNRTNTATVYPGKDGGGADMSIDTNAANNTATANTQVTKGTLAGRVFLDLNNNGDQDGTTITTDQGIGNVTIALTGTDRWGNAVSRSVTTDNSALGGGSTRGDYLFDNLAASDATGYTVTQTQPGAFGNGTPQPNTVRTLRNGASSGASGPYAVNNTAGTSVISGVRLDVGAAAVQFDFPESQKPTVSGFVFLDANSDGNKTAGEGGINGVSVRLIGCNAGPNGVIDTAAPVAGGPVTCAGDDVSVDLSTTTATDPTLGAGYYRFVLDKPGRYSLLQQSAQPKVGSVTSLRGKSSAGSVDKISSAPGSNDAGTRGTVNATAATAGGALGVQQEAAAVVPNSQIRDIVITDSSGQSVNNNFGEVLPTRVSGTVYTEKGATNSNFAAGVDWPLPGASVTLSGTDDLGQAVSLNTTTSMIGSYSFDGLRPGTYQVSKTNPVGVVNEVGGAFPGQDVTNVTRGVRLNDDTINAIALQSGMDVGNTNFAVTNGPAPDAVIAGYVYVDRNRNHYHDNNEKTRLEGVTINLVQGASCEAGFIVSTDKTDMYGSVYFRGEVGKNYWLCEVQPAGYGNGNAEGVPGSNSIYVPNLPQGGSYGHSFGEWAGSISGSVYEDFGTTSAQLNNGLKDPGEKGIANVPVSLSGRDIHGLPVNLSTTTDANGNYTFDDLIESDGAGYTLVEGAIPVASGVYSDGKDTAGNASVAAGNTGAVNDQMSGIRIAAGERASGYNFGELKGSSISGTVFLDSNNNGRQDAGEAGIPSVQVSLTGKDNSGATVNRTGSTDGAGRYRFDDLPPSSAQGYVVTEQMAQPVAPGTQTVTSNGQTLPGTIDSQVVGVGTPVTVVPSAISGIVLPLAAQSVDNNFAEIIVLGPDLVVTKSADKSFFTEGNKGSYTVRVKNAGQAGTVGSYTVVDRLSASTVPAKWTLDSAAGTGWSCTISADKQQVSCDSSQVLAPGEENPSPIRLGVSIGVGATAFGPLRNVVKVTGGGEPPEKQPKPGEEAAPPLCTAQPELNVCQVVTPLQVSVGLDGHVWIDGSNKKVLDQTDKLMPSWIVEVYDVGTPGSGGKTFTDQVRNGTPTFTTNTDAQGHYQVCGLEPEHEYRVLFRDPASRIAFPGVVTNEGGRVTGSEYWSQVRTVEGFEVLRVLPPKAPPGASSTACNVTAIEQSLPMDPNGVVYNSVTRQPVPGATVALVPVGSCPGYDPKLYIINYESYGKDAAGNPTMVTGPTGFYKFLLSGDPAAPKSCQFKLVVTEPFGYKPPPSAVIAPKPALNTPAAPGIYNVQPQKPAPQPGEDTSYHFVLTLGLSHQEVFNNHIPLDPMILGTLTLQKTGDKRVVQIGDTVLYTITVTQTAGDFSPQATVRDTLPPGFTLVPGTVRVNGQVSKDPSGGVGPVLAFNLGTVKGGQPTVLTYRVRVGVGALQGDGINSASAHSCYGVSGCIDSGTKQPVPGATHGNTGRYQVQVTGGVFTDSACLLGKVFVDCNHNHIQDPEELGIPGVRLYLETGASLVSDSEGKYSLCGITPRSHVLKVDPGTLPRGARLTTSSNRNLGDAGSLFIDAKNGELQRADFIEGSCSSTVLDQVKARRAQGEIRSVQSDNNNGGEHAR